MVVSVMQPTYKAAAALLVAVRARDLPPNWASSFFILPMQVLPAYVAIEEIVMSSKELIFVFLSLRLSVNEEKGLQILIEI